MPKYALYVGAVKLPLHLSTQMTHTHIYTHQGVVQLHGSWVNVRGNLTYRHAHTRTHTQTDTTQTFTHN